MKNLDDIRNVERWMKRGAQRDTRRNWVRGERRKTSGTYLGSREFIEGTIAVAQTWNAQAWKFHQESGSTVAFTEPYPLDKVMAATKRRIAKHYGLLNKYGPQFKKP